MAPNDLAAPTNDPERPSDVTAYSLASQRPEGEPTPERRLPLRELTRAAGVSVRTVRYYIAEGLLPPPVGGGPRSAYTQGHLDRLRLIALLKERYLPLKEIRRRVAGLDDAEVRRLLIEDTAEVPPSRPLVSAEGEDDQRFDLPSRTTPLPDPPPPRAGFHVSAVAGDIGHPPIPSTESTSHPVLGRTYPAPSAPDIEFEDDDPAPNPEPTAWRRVPLGDDAELLIRESAYRRRRDGIDWLVAWARKVFG